MFLYSTSLFVYSFQFLIAGARNPIMIRVPGYTPGQPVPQHAFPKPPTLDDWNLHNQKILSGRSGRPTGATVIEKRIIQVGWFFVGCTCVFFFLDSFVKWPKFINFWATTMSHYCTMNSHNIKIRYGRDFFYTFKKTSRRQEPKSFGL